MRRALLIAIVWMPQASADTTRSDATVEMSVGAAALDTYDGASVAKGLAFNLGVGAFFSPWSAFSVRWSGVVGDGVTGEDGPGFFGTIGPNLQVWPHERVWIGGGVGLGLGAWTTPVDLRVGYSLVSTPFKSLGVSLEAITANDARGRRTSIALLLGYQTF